MRDRERLSPIRTAIFVVLFIAIMAALPDPEGSIRRDPDLSDAAKIALGVIVFAVLFAVIKPYRRSK